MAYTSPVYSLRQYVYSTTDKIAQNLEPSTLTSGTYTKIKEMKLELKIYPDVPRLYTKFSLYNVNPAETTYGKVYRNGVPIGVEKSASQPATVVWDELNVTLNRGDKLQIYAKTTNGSVGEVKNWYLYGFEQPFLNTLE